jgi:hypothetical protein
MTATSAASQSVLQAASVPSEARYSLARDAMNSPAQAQPQGVSVKRAEGNQEPEEDTGDYRDHTAAGHVAEITATVTPDTAIAGATT